MLTVLLPTGSFLKPLPQVERVSYLIHNYLPPAPYPLWFYGLKRYKSGSSLLKIHFNLAGKLKSDMTTCDRGPWAVVIKAQRELWRWRKVRSLQAGCNHHPHTWPPPVSLCTAQDLELRAGHLYYRLPNWENTLFTAWVMNLYLVQQRIIFNYRAEPTHTWINSANEQFIKWLADVIDPVNLGLKRAFFAHVCTFGQLIQERLTESI